MRLADFILSDMDRILVDWEAFAATLLPAANSMSSLALRDHAQQILEAVARDLTVFQSREAQREKSLGLAPELDAAETAAQTHAVLRAHSGFNINQLVAEYRALRASVIRLYLDDCLPESPSQEDIIRFNEAIDQALAESVTFFTKQVERSRSLFLGMIGHDFRNPLQTIKMTSQYLSQLDAGEEVSRAAARLIRGGTQMQALLDDLVDYNRAGLGLGLRIKPKSLSLAALFEEGLEQLRAADPNRRLELEAAGNTEGKWDSSRLQQLLENLVTNAIKYGTDEHPVKVCVIGEEDLVRFEVRNIGPPIAQTTMERLFEPLSRGEGEQESPQYDSLGLGLFIAREIARAHKGEIAARREINETVFSVSLPKGTDEEGVNPEMGDKLCN